MEKEGDYMIKMIEKMIREDIRSMCIKKQAEEDFTAYVDAWMPRSICELSFSIRKLCTSTDDTSCRLVGSSGCRSWYKGGTIDGRVSGLWPGSILHVRQSLAGNHFPNSKLIIRTISFIVHGNTQESQI